MDLQGSSADLLGQKQVSLIGPRVSIGEGYRRGNNRRGETIRRQPARLWR